MKKSSISIVIPVYRGAESITELTARIIDVMEKVADKYEIIFVHDVSPDRSWEVIQQLVAKHSAVRGIDLMKNAGQHNALLCGVRHARYELIVTMDDDLQHPPEHIPQLVEKVLEGYDLVYGVPMQEPRSFARNLMSRLIKKVILKGTKGGVENISSFRAFRTQLRDAFADTHHPSVFLDLMLSWGARNIAEVKIPHETRKIGTSSYTSWRLISHAMNMITSFSVMPLHLASMIGFVFVLFGFLILFVTMLSFVLFGRVAPGFYSLASMIAIFSGTQLFAIGVVGLYIARLYEGMMAKPPYLVRTEIGADSTPVR